MLRPILHEFTSHWPWLLAAWLCAAAVSPASGQIPYNAVCRVDAPITARESSGGSGTLIHTENGRGIVITAYHVIEGARGQISVTFRTSPRTRYAARVVKVNRGYDLAGLVIEAPEGVAPAPSVKEPTKEDAPFVRVGYPWYGQGRQYRNEGGYIGFPPNSGQSAWAQSMIHTSGTVDSGFSGGALFSREGYFCGILSGNTSPDMSVPMDRTWGASGNVLVEFCQSCCGGNCPVYSYPQRRPNRVVVTQPAPVQPQQPAINVNQIKTDILAELKVKIDAAKCQCQAGDYATKADLVALSAQVDILASSTAKLSQSVQSIADANASITNTINNLPDPYQPPTDEELAEKIQPHLKHSATITLPNGTKKLQTKPLDVPLDFVQHPEAVK